MNYMLAQILNCKKCNAGIPDGYEVAAVVDSMLELWGDFSSVEATAQKGVGQTDMEIIRDTIERYHLTCTPDEAAAALVEECQARVEAAREEEEEEGESA